MTPTQTDEHEYTVPMSDKPRAKELAQKAIRNYRKTKNPVCNQHASVEPAPTLDVDAVLAKSERRV